MKEGIPELYIAIRNFAFNCGVNCENTKNFIEGVACEISDPKSEGLFTVNSIFQKEDVERWEEMIKKDPKLLGR